MDKFPEKIGNLIDSLRKDRSEKAAFLGFDASIDYIVKIVREKQEGRISGYFSSSTQFGEFLAGLDNKSAGVELMTKLSKPGGNMVIMANALGNLDVEVECAGTFGFPEILPAFHLISENCHLHSVGETISATALEFDNSKVIMFDPGPYNNLKWEDIRDILGIDRIITLLSGKKLVAFVNWSEIGNSTQIWRGFIDEVFPSVLEKGEKPCFFTDLSDCSRKSKSEILEIVNTLQQLREFFRVILSLNRNEAELLARALDINDNMKDEEFLKHLYALANSDVILVHRRTDDAVAFDGKNYEQCETFFCSNPAILTGGGDNFNAGYCFGLLSGLELPESLLLANAVAGYYVAKGTSPRKDELIGFLGDYL
jgi:sugar/nucleoside kinase (ribokinase family)